MPGPAIPLQRARWCLMSERRKVAYGIWVGRALASLLCLAVLCFALGAAVAVMTGNAILVYVGMGLMAVMVIALCFGALVLLWAPR